MKITLNVDEGLLESVMLTAGTTNKTKAIDLALREYARRAELQRLGRIGLGLTPDQLAEAIDPAYDLMSTRLKDAPIPHGRKKRSG